MTFHLGPRPPLRESVRVPAPDRWRVVAYDFDGRIRFVAAEFDRHTAEKIAADLIPRPDVASVHVERVTRERESTP